LSRTGYPPELAACNYRYEKAYAKPSPAASGGIVLYARRR
jgi:hypothetical protein